MVSPLFFSIYIDEPLCKLKKSGFGCNIGRYYFGALGYADDVVLLCPTKEGLRNMIRICENYASEHDLIFNGTKSKLLIYGNVTNCLPKLYVNQNEVPVCNTAVHLGNLISNDEHEIIDFGISKFNSNFNYFMSSFGKCQSSVKNKLFLQYCNSFYESHDLYTKMILSRKLALDGEWL